MLNVIMQIYLALETETVFQVSKKPAGHQSNMTGLSACLVYKYTTVGRLVIISYFIKPKKESVSGMLFDNCNIKQEQWPETVKSHWAWTMTYKI